MKLTKSQQIMKKDGAPAGLFMTLEQRAVAWSNNPPRPMLLFIDKPRNEDAATAQFRAEQEELRKTRQRAHFDRLKARQNAPKIDTSKMRWDSRRNKWEPITTVAQAVQAAPAQTGRKAPAVSSGNVFRMNLPLSKESEVAVRVIEYTQRDPDRVKALGEANGVWQDSFEKMNNGLKVMNVTNRLKKAVREGKNVVWP